MFRGLILQSASQTRHRQLYLIFISNYRLMETKKLLSRFSHNQWCNNIQALDKFVWGRAVCQWILVGKWWSAGAGPIGIEAPLSTITGLKVCMFWCMVTLSSRFQKAVENPLLIPCKSDYCHFDLGFWTPQAPSFILIWHWNLPDILMAKHL